MRRKEDPEEIEVAADVCEDCYVSGKKRPLRNYRCGDDPKPLRICEDCRCEECIPVEDPDG